MMEFTTSSILTVVGLLVTVLGLLVGLIKWALSEYNKKAAAHTQAIQESIKVNYKQVNEFITSLRNDIERHRNESAKRMNDTERKIYEFKEHVADKYVKKESWLDHAVRMERKLDLIVRSVHEDNQKLYDIISKVSQRRIEAGKHEE